MANLASSGTLSLDDIIKNRTGAAGTNVSLKNESESFASGSEVAGTVSQSLSRKNLDTAPYAITEFYNADFNTDILSSITTTSSGSVDGENLGIVFVTDGSETGTYTVQLINTSTAAIVGTTTVSVSSGTSHNATFSSFTVNAATYRVRVSLGFATLDDDATFTHHKAIGAVSVTDPSDTTVAASSTEHEITHARSIGNTTSLNDYNWTFATTTAGDDGYDPNPTTSVASTPTVTYTGPGTYTANLRVDGTPSQARNSTTSATVTHTIEYTDSLVCSDDANTFDNTSTDMSVASKGMASGVKIGYVSSSATSTFLVEDTTDSTDTRFQAATITKAITTATSLKKVVAYVRAEDKTTTSTNDLSTNTFIIYPKLSTSRNVISPTVRTIYSTTQNTGSAGTPTSFAFNSPTTRTDNLSSREYTESDADISFSGDTTPSSQTATQPTVNSTTTVGSATVTYTVQGSGPSGTQETATACTVTINYAPRIFNITYSTANLSGGNFMANSSTVSLTALDWQGFDVGSSGFSVGVYTAQTGGSEISSIGAATLNGSDLTDGILDNNTGGAQIGGSYCKWLGTFALGTVSSTGTVYVRILALAGSPQGVYSEALTVASWNNVSVVSRASSGWSDGEDATQLEGASFTTDAKSYLGTLQDGTVLYNDANGTGGVFNGGSYWHNDDTNNYVMVVNGSGVVSSYTSDLNIIPKAPSSLTLAAQSNATQINITWNDNSAIETGFKVYMNTGGVADSGDTLIATQSGTSYNKTGLTAGTTYYFAVYAYRGSSLSSVIQQTQQTQLVDATTITGLSAQNGQAAITVAGNQSGFSGGVTFGLVSSSADTTFLSTNSTNDETDSRYTLDAYTGAFTPDDPYGNTATQKIKGRVIDRSDGTSGQNRNTAEVIVYPTLTTSKNTIGPTTKTIYSTTQNTGSAGTPTSFTFSEPGAATDNVTAYAYSEASDAYGVIALSNTSTSTATATANTKVGIATARLTITGGGASGDQSTHTDSVITVNYAPRIYNITYSTGNLSGGSFAANSSTVSLTALQWQGFDVGSSGFSVGVFAAQEGGSAINSLAPLIISGSDLTSGIIGGITGGAQTGSNFCQWGGTVALGTVSSTGTVYVRITALAGSPQGVYSETLTVASWNNVSVTYRDSGGWSTPEDAKQLEGSGFSAVTKYYLGTFANGTDLYNGANGTGGLFDGNDYYYNINSGDVFKGEDATGDVEEYQLAAHVTPKPPTGIGFTNQTTSAITVSWTDVSAIEDDPGYYIFFKTGTANDADTDDSPFPTDGNGLAAGTETDEVTGLSEDEDYSFVVYAKRGNSYSTALRGTSATIAGTSWGSYNAGLNANCGIEGMDRNCTTRYLTLTAPDTGANQVNATISNLSGMSGINNLYVAVGTSNNPTNWSTSTAQTTATGASDVIYVRMRVDSNKAGEEDGTFTMTLENGGVSKIDNNLEWTIEGE